MAGSYKHIINNDGSFRGNDLIENGGDSYEALQECYEMIQWLTKGDKFKIYEAWYYGYFKKHCPPSNESLATFERFWEHE